jgi:DNA-binding transcriptional MerR regulator
MARPQLSAVDSGQAGQEASRTIEELAAEIGMTVRNIRSHRARGLLPPPEVRERIGYYGPEHVARLRVIQQLQAEGFNLQGIKRLLDRTGGAERLVSMTRTLSTPFETEQPQVFTRDELAARFGQDAAALEKAIETGGLVSLGDDRYEAPAPSLLEAAEEVVAHGVTLHHALVVMGKVRERCDRISREFVRLFLEDVWKPFVEAGYPEERWEEVIEAIDRLRPISTRAVLAMYGLTMSEQIEEAFGREVQRLTREKRK